MRTTPMAPSSIRWTPSAITGIYQGRGRCSFPINQKASCKRVWSPSTTVYGRMFGLSWERRPRHARTFSFSIASPVNIPSSIARYQKTLQYASTSLDFVFGLGLYLAPSDMTLHPGNVQCYNKEIVIAGSEAAIGHNPGINESEQIGKTTDNKSFEGKIAAPAGTDHKGPPSGRPAGSPPTPATVAPQQHTAATSHEEEKTALIAAVIGVGLVALWLSLR